MTLTLLALGLAHAADGPRLDRDNDGVSNRHDACPSVAEDLDGYRDTDGCPDATVVTLVFSDPQGLRTDASGMLGGQALSGPGEYQVTLMPGTHRLQVWAAGFEPFTGYVDVRDGDPMVRSVTLIPTRGTAMAVAVGG